MDRSMSSGTRRAPDIGLDVGLKSFLTDSEGNTIDNPRSYRMSQATLRRKHRLQAST